MLAFIIFLIGIVCAIVAIGTAVIWLAAATVQGTLTCLERALTSFADGRMISALLYLIPTTPFFCALAQGLYLACSFVTEVLLR
jgi:hypothetical protein